jgi:hypothetical protein
MEEIIKAIAKGILIRQSTNIGLKIVNEKRIAKKDWQGLGLAFAFFILLNLPNPQNQDVLSRNHFAQDH